MSEPIKDWMNEAWKVFGYKMLGKDNHEAIARLLEDIDQHLLDKGPTELKVILNRGTVDLSPLTAIGEDLDRIGSLLRPHAIERAYGETDESLRNRALVAHREKFPKPYTFNRQAEDVTNTPESLAAIEVAAKYAQGAMIDLLTPIERLSRGFEGMYGDPNGEYVSYEDHLRKIAYKDAEIKRLRDCR